jgi:hypothetical protein
MPKSKQRKNHKAKVSNRNERIKQQKRKVEKIQRDFIMNLIKKEQENGLFDNNQSIEPVIQTDVPKLDIDGPVI